MVKMPPQDEQAARLRAAREAKGLDNAKAGAVFVGAKQHTYTQHENGTRRFLRVVDSYAERYGVSPAWLIWGEQEDGRPATRVPIFSWVSAGGFVDSNYQPEEADGFLDISGLPRGRYFATRVAGDSMDRVSPEGSIIIVNRDETDLISGRAYLFGRGGETTYKRWHDDPPRLEPFSTNPYNEAIFPKKGQEIWITIGRVRRTIFDL